MDILEENTQTNRFSMIIRITILALLLYGCEEDKKFTVKTVEIEKTGVLHWYYYSLITNYSPDQVEFVDDECNSTRIYEGHGVTDVSYALDTIKIECIDCNMIFIDSSFQIPIVVVERNNFRGQIDYRKRTGNISEPFNCK
jgi:hypothetical protein